jgi:thiamine transport system permease protein
MRSLLRITLVLFFVAPILIWLLMVPHWSWPGTDWLRPLFISLVQAGASAAASLVFGVLMTMGALAITKRRSDRLLEFWLLIPNLIPSLFLILAMLNLSLWIPFFRPSFLAVILAHVLLNSGLVALALLRLVGARLSGFIDLAIVEGARRRMIWLEVILPSLKRELMFLFLFVFSVCLTSFSIPLVLGGMSVSNFEILIYQTLRTNSDWSKVLDYALIQLAMLTFLAVLVPKPQWSIHNCGATWPALGLKRFLPLTLAPSLILLIGWGSGIVQSLRHYVYEDLFFDPGMAALTTLIVALGTGFMILILCLWISFVWPHPKLSIFMKSYLAPSSAITGFSFLLLPGQEGNWPLLKMIMALALVTFPLLFRWLGQSALESLEEQIAVARTLGASWSQILFEIIWPQRAATFLRMSGLGALWASGDFALTSIMAEGHRTWAIWIDSLLNSYRLDLASLLTIPLFAIGLICYGFFVGAARYVNR